VDEGFGDVVARGVEVNGGNAVAVGWVVGGIETGAVTEIVALGVETGVLDAGAVPVAVLDGAGDTKATNIGVDSAATGCASKAARVRSYWSISKAKMPIAARLSIMISTVMRKDKLLFLIARASVRAVFFRF
jgi:hypothetical protein